MATHRRVWFYLAVVLVTSQFYSAQSFGWGALGHRTVARTAAQNTTDGNAFWAANAANFANLSTVPDRVWKSLPSAAVEKPTHWFQLDFYFKSADQYKNFPLGYDDAVGKYSEAVVRANGTAIWRVAQFYQMGVEALQHHDFKAAIQYAGVMSHYVGDLSQPLHVTTNYDGGETGDPGIHKFFETDNLANAKNLFSELDRENGFELEGGNRNNNRRKPNNPGNGSDASDLADNSALDARVTSAALKLMRDTGFTDQTDRGGIVNAALLESARSVAFKDKVINTDLKQGRTGRGAVTQLGTAIQRMADGSATLSLLLARMWRDAGSPDASGSLTVSTPEWVAPSYSELKRQSSMEEDDCAAE